MSDTVVEVKGLSSQAGAHYLLYDINWEIKRGEQWVVFGRNGCGKTTLLSTIAGYRKFTGGTLKVFGEEYNKDNILELRKRIGWISSSFFDKLYTSERVLDIVLSGAFGTMGTNFQVTDVQVKRAKALLDEVGMLSRVMSPYDTLSKGERQQVLIARAFMSNPELLILDEPGTGLDAMARAQLLSTIGKIAEENDRTIIFVTHYPEEVLPAFDKCLLIRSGIVYQTGNTEELFTDEVMSDFFEYPVEITNDKGLYQFNIKSDALEGLLGDGGDRK